MKKIGLVTLAGLVLAGLWLWYWQAQASPHGAFRTARAERGPFLAAISATGTLEPMEAVDIGAQVAGRISRFGIDPRTMGTWRRCAVLDSLPLLIHGVGVLTGGLAPIRTIDYGTPVEEGTILAQLDAALYQTEVELCKAELHLARAGLSQLEAKLQYAEADWRRAQELNVRKSIAPLEYDLARAAFQTAQANLESGKATIEKAQTSLKKAEINLGYATIRSPVKGVILDRRVNVGQTVVASLNAPSMFLIASDLRRLQVWASVNEADIGQITVGQNVRFTVDAHPGEVFIGHVAEDQPRLNATMTQNVVTYTVVIDTDNANLKLIPYLTANLQFVLTQKSSALLVPNAALRWRPQLQQIVAEAREAFVEPRRSAGPSALDPREPHERVVWVPDHGHVRPVKLLIGLSDGTMSEVLGGALAEHDQVVIGEQSHQDDGPANPFTTNMYGGKKTP